MLLGKELAHYTITEKIGQGGMGDVYRARDSRLNRDVALKVLPAEWASDDARLQRFRREAETVAALNHSNIVTLYSIEESDGVNFLTMELLEGRSLDAVLTPKGLPLPRVLEVGMAIASALSAAHEKGIVHRDLKPANIILTNQGAKLLDFGLAKSTTNRGLDARDSTQSVAQLTGAGTIVGTPQYMAPEQLEGHDADARSDVFALGAVLYEMLTGRKAFRAESTASLIAAILTAEPTPVTELRPLIPTRLDRLIRSCLAKNPAERWHSARDLMLELTWISEVGSSEGLQRPAGWRREPLAWTTVAILAIILVWLVVTPDELTPPIRAARFDLALPDRVSTISRVTASPDGRYVSLSASRDGESKLWLRPVNGLDLKPLPGTEGTRYHFWSPDGRFLGFFAGGELKKIDIDVGRPQTVCPALGFGPFNSGSWGADGTILFSVSEAQLQNGLYQVRSSGGVATRRELVDPSGQPLEGMWPHFLPDGKHFVFRAVQVTDGAPRDRGTWLGSLDSDRARPLLEDVSSYVEYAAPGYLLYVNDGTLMAQPFRPDRLRTHGSALPVIPQVTYHAGTGWARFGVSRSGILTYVSQAKATRLRLLLKDRSGQTVTDLNFAGDFRGFRFSPDGKRLAIGFEDDSQDSDIWTIELERNVATRFTSSQEDVGVGAPIWSPDGKQIVFSQAREAPPFMHRKPLNGGEAEQLLPSTGTLRWASDWSRDGQNLLFIERHPETRYDIWILPLDGSNEPRPFLRTRFQEAMARFSPDGQWVAYTSDESGEWEIYVRPFTGPGEKRRVSKTGGFDPYWREDGAELFYVDGANQVMAVPVQLKSGFEPGPPTPLFEIDGSRSFSNFAASADGKLFAVTSGPGPRDRASVVLNWSTELPR